MTDPFAQPSESRHSHDPEAAGGNAAYSYDGVPDRYKRYRLPDPDTGGPMGYTRTTTFAKSISDTYTLSLWQQRMAVKGIVMREDLYAAAASTPLENRDGLNEIVEAAKETAGAKTGANLGTALHAFTEAIDRHETIVIPPPWRPHVAAWTMLLEQYGLEVLDVERTLLNRQFDVAGTLDRIVRFTRDVQLQVGSGKNVKFRTIRAGTIVILDLKTGRDLEYGWMEIAVQLAIYNHADLLFDKTSLTYEPMVEGMDTDVALVVHLPATAPGNAVVATMYAVDTKFGWETAELCHQVRQARKRKNIAVELAVVEETAQGAVLVPSGPEDAPAIQMVGSALEHREPTLLERVRLARTDDELKTLWFEAIRTRQDTTEMTLSIKKRRQEIYADTAGG